ncbi:MAG: 2-C-methyl-D-erythritol 2,4-cyclodiphosphate synthase [Acidimicrobiia bacterium]
MKTRVGLGFDVHPFDNGRPTLVLGGVQLPGPGLAGHSDADVVAHAVADAMLGAAGLGDLGTMFPADDAEHRNADSLQLLRAVVDRVSAARWWVENVDVVVAAEQPRLAPHLTKMIANLSGALAAGGEPMGGGVAVSVKPKRAEGLGSIGRGEGIAAWAVALLARP